MALSNEWTEWHLTPRGWVEGSTRVDGGGVTRVPDPPDSVAVYCYREQQSSMYSRMESSTSFERRRGTEEQEAELIAKFGRCPERL